MSVEMQKQRTSQEYSDPFILVMHIFISSKT